MAEFDFDLFIDNVLKNKSNAELMKIERAPAAQQEKQVVIQESGKIAPIEYPSGYKPQVPQSEIIRQNVNPVIEQQQQSARDLGANLKDIYGEYSGYKGGMQDALKNLQTVSQRRFESPELDEKITAAQADYSGIKDVPERDLLTEAILSFGPAVFGALGGESAQIAQLPAGQKAREMYEGRRKEDIERVKQLREQADKRYKTLVEMKKTQQESFDKSQQREMDRLKAVLSGSGDLAKMSGDELKTTEQRLLDLQKDIAKGTTEGATEVAKMERGAELEANKERRANIMASIAQQKVNLPTQGERDAAARLGRAQNASAALDALKAKAGGYPSLKDKSYQFKLEQFASSGPTAWATQVMVKDPKIREQITLEMEWGANFLRDETGAAITQNEMPFELNKYFARAGDTPDIVRKKEQLRRQVESGLEVQAGRAKPIVAAPATPQYKDGDTKKIGGKTYVRKGGKWQEKN